MADNNVNPKSQRELSQDAIQPYEVEQYKADKTKIDNKTKREYQRSVKNDKVKKRTVGLRDIDEAIFYYFNNVSKPSVIQNGNKKTVRRGDHWSNG